MTDKEYRVEHVASKPTTNLHKNHKVKENANSNRSKSIQYFTKASPLNLTQILIHLLLQAFKESLTSDLYPKKKKKKFKIQIKT